MVLNAIKGQVNLNMQTFLFIDGGLVPVKEKD